jgi:plastocyanin domain-containing protein
MRTLVLVVAAMAVVSGCKKDMGGGDPGKGPQTPARTVEMKVTEDGFVPGNISLKKGEPVKFRVTRVTENTCATELLVSGTDIKVALPLNEPAEFSYTPDKAGEVKFGCAMDMMVSGVMVVE